MAPVNEVYLTSVCSGAPGPDAATFLDGSMTKIFSGLLALMLGGAGCDRSVETDMTACGSQGTPEAREECRFQVALGLGHDREAQGMAVMEVPEGVSRDLVRLRLALHDPIAYGRLCNDVTVREIQERCRMVNIRPHLMIPHEPNTP